LAASTHGHQIINKFLNFCFDKWNIGEGFNIFLHKFYLTEFIFFEIFNFNENNIINVEAAMVLG
jgi:hypothetical protein